MRVLLAVGLGAVAVQQAEGRGCQLGRLQQQTRHVVLMDMDARWTAHTAMQQVSDANDRAGCGKSANNVVARAKSAKGGVTRAKDAKGWAVQVKAAKGGRRMSGVALVVLHSPPK